MRLNILRLLSVVMVFVLAAGAPAWATTLRVCASGCAYTALQPAIDAAAPGDTILLRAGETFVGPFILRAKPASTSWITIRSDADDAVLPASGVRLVPSGKPGANTARTLLPRLVGQGGALKTTPVIRTSSGAHHYLLKFLEVDGSANLGFETLIALGDDTTSAPPHDLVIDRVYAHGDFYRGMKRGISLNSERTDILNSYISDIKSVNADSQAIAGYNGAGPFRIVNNYLEGAGENIIFGGSDPAVANLVPSDIEIRGNHLFKPLAWKNPILGTPASPHAAGTTSGSLSGGTHYFKVVALMSTDTRTAVSAPSAEVSASVATGGTVSLTWSGVAGADRYRIYRGTSAGGESKYMTTVSAATSFQYTGASESSGTPAASGTRWTVKNIFELKNAQRVVLDGNLIENIWQAGQYRLRARADAAESVRRRHVGARPRHHHFEQHRPPRVRGAAVVGLRCHPSEPADAAHHPPQQSLLRHRSEDVGRERQGLPDRRGACRRRPRSQHPHPHEQFGRLRVWLEDHRRIRLHEQHLAARHLRDHGRERAAGPVQHRPVFSVEHDQYNVLAGGSASAYPTPNAFPTVAQWQASFEDFAGGDYRLRPTSPFFAAGANGSVPGADLDAVYAAVNAGGTTNPPPPGTTDPPPPPPSNSAPVARPGGPYAGTPGAAITVDGSASSDSDGSIASYRWTWGDEIVLDAADVPPAGIVGNKWVREQVSGAAGGWVLHNPNANAAKLSAASSSPSSYVEVRFHAAAGVPYHLWFRMRADGDSYANDSLFVQFSGSVDAQGKPVKRIGSSGAGIVVLEEGNGAGVSGFGWNDEAYGTLAAPVYFATTGLQTLRVQQREDGVMWDQIVLSAVTYAKARPGSTRGDTNILAQPAATTAAASHVYGVGGTFPAVLTVTDNDGASSSAAATVAIGAGTGSLTARAGGPYTGTVGHAVVFDGSTSTSTSATQYVWHFGDEVVLDASVLDPVGSRWQTVTDGSAAGGTASGEPRRGPGQAHAGAGFAGELCGGVIPCGGRRAVSPLDSHASRWRFVYE